MLWNSHIISHPSIRVYTECNWKVRTNLGTSSTYQNKKKYPYRHVSGNILFVSYIWKGTFKIRPQNVLHEIQRTPRHVSSWTATSVQRCRGSCGYSDRHPHCSGEVPLRCQQELHAQGTLGVPTGEKLEDSDLASVEVMQWVLLYAIIDHSNCYWEYLAQHG
jgi:hypothetical protein